MRKSFAGLLSDIERTMGDAWLPLVYRARVLKSRTRAYEFPVMQRRAEPYIHHTLLGIELKVAGHRLLCPDLATARYLSVFARARCRAIAIPYNITKISQLAEVLESSWYCMLLLADNLAERKSVQFKARLRCALIDKVRKEIDEAGAGQRIPEFRQSTRQRQLQKGKERIHNRTVK